MNLETKIIIPAAGYGTRVGSPESKEMLKLIDDSYLIDYALKIAELNQARAHVITRTEKKNLIDYLTSKPNVEVQTIEPSREWPDTILKSRSHWADYNILILPDTDFEPVSVVTEMIAALKNVDLSVATFNTDNLKTWGAFQTNQTNYNLIEKPDSDELADFKAWGILGFRKEIGIELFSLLLESTIDNKLKKTNFSFKQFELITFKDLTR